MSKKVFVLVHDYWHHDDSIKPMMDYLFNADYEVTFTKNPNDYFNGQFDLFLSFKDPIEMIRFLLQSGVMKNGRRNF